MANQPAMTLSNWTPTTVDITINSPYASGTFELRLALQEPEGLQFQYNNTDRSNWIQGSGPVSSFGGEWEHTFSQALTGTGNNTITITGVNVNHPYVAYGWCDDGAGSTTTTHLVYRTFQSNSGQRRIRISKPTQELVYGVRASKVVSGSNSNVSFPLNDIAQAGDAIIIAFVYDNVPSNYLTNRIPVMTSDIFYRSTSRELHFYEYELDDWNDDGSQNTFSGDWFDQGNLPSTWSAAVMCISNGDNNYEREGLSDYPSSFSVEVTGPPTLWRARLDSQIGGLSRSEEIKWGYFYVGDANTVTVAPYMEEYDAVDAQGPPAYVITDEVAANGYRGFGFVTGGGGLWSNRDFIAYMKMETSLTTPTPAFWSRAWLPEPAKWLNAEFSQSTYNRIICTGDANWPYGYVVFCITTVQNVDPTLGAIEAGTLTGTVTYGYGRVRAKNANDREGELSFDTGETLVEKQTYWVYFYLENHGRSTVDSRDAQKTNIFEGTYQTPDGPNETVNGITEQLTLTPNQATVTQGYRPASIVSVFPDVWQDNLENIVITTDAVVDNTSARVWVRNRPMPITASTKDTITVTADQQDLIDEELYRLTITDYEPGGQQTTDTEYLALLLPPDPFESDVTYQWDCDDIPLNTTSSSRNFGYINVAKLANWNESSHGTIWQFNRSELSILEDADYVPWGRRFLRTYVFEGTRAGLVVGNSYFAQQDMLVRGPITWPVCWEFWFRLSPDYLWDYNSSPASTKECGIWQDFSTTTDSGFGLFLQAGDDPAPPIPSLNAVPSSNPIIDLVKSTNGYLGFRLHANGTSFFDLKPGPDPNRLVHKGKWYHGAIQRNSLGVWDVWLNGKNVFQQAESTSVNIHTSIERGAIGCGSDAHDWSGNYYHALDWKGVRITRDVERYTSGQDFTPTIWRPLKAWAD